MTQSFGAFGKLTLEINLPNKGTKSITFDLQKLVRDGAVIISQPTAGTDAVAVADKKTNNKSAKAGFLDLPPELRNPIYRRLFVFPDDPVRFNCDSKENTQRSAQLLRTCRQVYNEGRAVLYGENAFHFKRTLTTRGAYYDPMWKEVGYKDVRRFLETIKPRNIAHMKHVSIELLDAAPQATPFLDTEDRRYINDPILYRVLDLIGASVSLERFAISFLGKQRITVKDLRFLKAITNIKCMELIHVGLSKEQCDRYDDLMKKMARLMLFKKEKDPNVDEGRQKDKIKMRHEKDGCQHVYKYQFRPDMKVKEEE